MKRIICLLLLICLALPATAFAEQQEYVGRMMVTNCKREVSLRAEPTENSERLDWVPYHAILENCRSGYGEYYYVEYYGTPGYIHSDYVEVYEGDPEMAYAYPEYYEVMQIVGCPEWTPLREMADVNAKQIAKVPLGAVVTDCLYYADDYTYVNYSGMEGYVLTEYITLGDGNDVQPDLSVKYVTNCNTEVSLRAEATSESKRLAWVPKGTAIEAIAAENGYFYVCYNGQYGYIHGDYLAYIGYTGDYVGEMTVSVDAIMYKEPDIGFGQLTVIPAGSVVENCYRAHNGYYWVCYNDVFGYVHGTDFKAYGDELVSDQSESDVSTGTGNGNPEAVGGPYSDSDDILSNTRTTLNSEEAGFGVYLISDLMGGEWSVIQEKNHLQNVLRGMSEEWWQLTMAIPDEQIIEIIGGSELYLIIPADEKASVTVNRLQLGADGFTGIVEEELYHSESGEPILLRCNEYDAVMDCEITIVGSDGSFSKWYPCVNPNNGWVSTDTIGGICVDITDYELGYRRDY